VSDREIYDFSPNHPEFCIFLSIPAYTKHIDRVRTGGSIIIDSVIGKYIKKEGKVRQDIILYEIPALKMASEIGNTIVANTIMLGFLLRKLGIVDLDRVKNVLSSETNVQKWDMNLKALVVGWNR